MLHHLQQQVCPVPWAWPEQSWCEEGPGRRQWAGSVWPAAWLVSWGQRPVWGSNCKATPLRLSGSWRTEHWARLDNIITNYYKTGAQGGKEEGSFLYSREGKGHRWFVFILRTEGCLSLRPLYANFQPIFFKPLLRNIFLSRRHHYFPFWKSQAQYTFNYQSGLQGGGLVTVPG